MLNFLYSSINEVTETLKYYTEMQNLGTLKFNTLNILPFLDI